MTSWRVFDIMTNLLMYFWRHDELFDVMMCLGNHYKLFMKSLQTFVFHDVFLTSWRTYCHDELFDVMTCLTLWTFWHHELFNVMMTVLTVWQNFGRVLASWQTFVTSSRTLEFMKNCLTSCHEVFMTSWRTFGRHEVFLMPWQTCGLIFDIMAELFDFKTNFLTFWRTFWRHYGTSWCQ